MSELTREHRERLVAAIGDASTLWELACALLAAWRSTEPGDSAWHAMTGEPYRAWGDLMHRTQQHFAGPRAADDVDGDDRRLLLDVTGHGVSANAVHAAAWGLSTATSHTFAPAWRDALDADRHQLKPGEMYPVADAPWAQLGVELSPRPASLAPPRVGELPTIRVHDGAGFDVTVDFTLARTLEAVAASLDRVVAIHPNQALGELEFPEVDRQIFPVAPKDPARQREILMALVGRALKDGAPVAVLPELSVTPDDVAALHRLVEAHDEAHLQVAGSCHAVIDGEQENVALGLVSGHEHRMEHRKATPFSSELGLAPPAKEGIRERQRPHVVLHQADRFRVALAVCKDLLDRRVPEALDRMGANLIFVPALSATTLPFLDACAARVARAQALTVVVNGPLEGKTGRPVQPAVVIGQPVAGRTTAPIIVSGPAPATSTIALPA